MDIVWQFVGSGVMGAFLGSLVINWMNENNKKKESVKQLAGALNLVRYELVANKTSIQLFLEDKGKLSLGPLNESRFREVQLTLARELPSSTMNKLATIYFSLPVYKRSAILVHQQKMKEASRLVALGEYVDHLEKGISLINQALAKSGYYQNNIEKDSNR